MRFYVNMYTLNAAFVGKVLLVFDELPSTNDYARLIANEVQTQEGTVVQTSRQTSGRGQMGAVWESAPGTNLTLSVILQPTWLRADQQFHLSKVVALAVYDTVQEVTEPLPANFSLQVKWPNDILLNGKKIAGILIENTISGAYLGISIAGIGLNVNQQTFSPALPMAGSLVQLTGHTFDTDHLAQRLFAHLELRYLQLRGGATDLLHTDYLARLLGYREHRHFELLPEGTQVEGMITGVDEHGRLVVENAGAEQKFGLKEIKMLL